MRLSLRLLFVGFAFLPAAGLAQQQPATGVAPPAPVESAPLPPPPAGPAPETPPPIPVPAAPAAPAMPAPSAGIRSTLVPSAGDPTDVDEVTLPGKPAAILSGTGTWDDGFKTLKNAFRKIEEELTRAAITPTGRPLTVFLQTDDLGFHYEAMIPIGEVPEGRTSLTPEIRFGKTPEGKALRFVHKDPYEEIDSTYETITAYLDAKGILAKDVFIEEYVTDLTDASEEIEINVFVQPR